KIAIHGYMFLPLVLGLITGLTLLILGAGGRLKAGSGLALGALGAVLVLGSAFAGHHGPAHNGEGSALAVAATASAASPAAAETPAPAAGEPKAAAGDDTTAAPPEAETKAGSGPGRLIMGGYHALPLFLAAAALLALLLSVMRKSLDGGAALGLTILLVTVAVTSAIALSSGHPHGGDSDGPAQTHPLAGLAAWVHGTDTAAEAEATETEVAYQTLAAAKETADELDSLKAALEGASAQAAAQQQRLGELTTSSQAALQAQKTAFDEAIGVMGNALRGAQKKVEGLEKGQADLQANLEKALAEVAAFKAATPPATEGEAPEGEAPKSEGADPQ
ncbi:MAG: hypothetical protein ACYS22_18645, partial [Planctomycetota bacterium]